MCQVLGKVGLPSHPSVVLANNTGTRNKKKKTIETRWKFYILCDTGYISGAQWQFVVSRYATGQCKNKTVHIVESSTGVVLSLEVVPCSFVRLASFKAAH